MTLSKQVAVRLSPDDMGRLDSYAATLGIKRSDAARRMIWQGLNGVDRFTSAVESLWDTEQENEESMECSYGETSEGE